MVLRQDSALPSPPKEVHDNELTSFAKMLWKFCLCPQQFEPLKQLPCLQRSPLSSEQAVVHTRHPPAPREFVQEAPGMLSVVSMCWLLFLWKGLKKNSKPQSLAPLRLISGWSTDSLCCVPTTGDSHWLYTLYLLLSFFQNLK